MRTPTSLRAASRGFTLAELTINSTLLVILLGIAYAGLLLAHRYYAESEAAVQVQQQATSGLKHLVSDLGGTPSTGVRTDTSGLTFVSARTSTGSVAYDTSGSVLWQSVVAYYVQGGVLYRKARTLTPTATIPSPLPTAAELRDDGSLVPRAVARQVETMTVTAGSPMTIQLRTASDDFGGSSLEQSAVIGFRP